MLNGISVTNQQRVEEALNRVQKNCRVRKTTYKDITDNIKKLENRLSDIMYKKDWKGVEFIINAYAQEFCKSYKGAPESTYIYVAKTANNWIIKSIDRKKCDNELFYPCNLIEKSKEIVDYLKKNF